ncbi:MAG: single-stranded-DNA-specific exonuclease RecJ [Gammaproteobacteria bacterium]
MLYHSTRKIIVTRSCPVDTQLPGNMHPLLKRILATRGVQSVEELDRSLAKLPSPWLLPGMETMVGYLLDAIDKQKKIVIVADYDADGATSCALAIKGLSLLGAREPVYIVPDRFRYGYGLTPEIVALATVEQPDMLLTVDNGITSIDGVNAAKALGMTVLVTDHHLPGKELPAADAIVNPALHSSEFPGAALAGVGVMFYVLLALRSRLRANGSFKLKPEPNLGQLLDLVALGTIADVVALDPVNRILVYQGLQRIRSGNCRAGLQALIEIAGKSQHGIGASDLGFSIAPRLNAAGRLDDMSLGIQCLLTDDAKLAKDIALQLDDLNRDRRDIEGQMKHEALRLLDAMKAFDERHLPAGICLYDESWHQGVIGILASRIKDRLHRPVIAFAPGTEGEIKGSARSIPGVHIRDVLSDIAAEHPKLLKKFGGHAMAAGLSLKLSDYPPFSMAFSDAVAKKLVAVDLEQKVFSDGQLPEDAINLEFAEILQNAGPWGQGFPEPLFDGIFEVVQCRILGQQHLKLVLRYPNSHMLIDAVAFFVEKAEQWLGVRSVKAAYKLDINEFRGNRNVQLIVQYLEKCV